MAAMTQLYTVVKNPTAGSRTYGFLPPHGMTIAAGGTKSIPGDLTTRIAGSRGVSSGIRDFKSFEACLEAGHIAIQRSPGVILYDGVTAESVVLAAEDNVLGTVLPDWAD